MDGKKVKTEQEVKRYGYTHALSALEQRDKKRNDARKEKGQDETPREMQEVVPPVLRQSRMPENARIESKIAEQEKREE